MTVAKDCFYIIKNSNDVIWKFFSNENKGIIYKIYEDNKWSEDYVLSQKASKNYSVILLPDNSLSVLYEDLNGMIIFSKYNGEQWTENTIVKNNNKDKYNISFKAITCENKVHIIFSILNKFSNTNTIFHQILEDNYNLSSPKFIDKMTFNYSNPFTLYTSYDGELFILYQRYIAHHELGYKIFNKVNHEWSTFRLLDKSVNPFTDYSALMINKIFYALYIRKELNQDILYFVHDNYSSLINNKIFQSKNISTCIILILFGQIWCLWRSYNKIYNSFSINNGKSFSISPYKSSLKALNIHKSAFISNKSNEKQYLFCNEVFFSYDNSIECLSYPIPFFYRLDGNNNTDSFSFIEYYLNEINLIALSYEKILIQKEQALEHLANQIKEKDEKIVSYENSISSISKQLIQNLSLYNDINEKIKSLKQCIIDKEKDIELLENINIKTKNEMTILKNQISQKESKIIFLINEIKKSNNNIKNAHLSI